MSDSNSGSRRYLTLSNRTQALLLMSVGLTDDSASKDGMTTEEAVDSLIEAAAKTFLALDQIHHQGDSLCVLTSDGRVAPVYLGDILNGPYQGFFPKWVDQDRLWPKNGPTIRVVRYCNPYSGVYAATYHCSFPQSGLDLTQYEHIFVDILSQDSRVFACDVGKDWLQLETHDQASPEDGQVVIQQGLRELCALLCLSDDPCRVVWIDHVNIAEAEDAIGFIEPQWSVQHPQ